jgi:hypothetical protein
VIKPKASTLTFGQRFSIDGNAIFRGDIQRRALNHNTVDCDTPGLDPSLGVAARTKSSPRHHACDALTFF